MVEDSRRASLVYDSWSANDNLLIILVMERQQLGTYTALP